MPYEEIARIEGARVGAVKSRINRARARLHAAMKDIEGGKP
jgi:DNA-directed RNA polymerase specialized sigma24 family protein